MAQESEGEAEEDEGSSATEQKSRWAAFLQPLIVDPSALSQRLSLGFLTGPMPDRRIYFTGFDIWRCGLAAYAGMQWAPNGINKDGFILRLFGSDGLERFTTRTRHYETQIFRGSALGGVRFKRGNVEMQVLGGPDIEEDYRFINKRLNAARRRIGARFAADLWWEPTRSLMLQSSVSGTTIDDGFNGRIAAGWRLFDRFWIGPEASFSRDFYSEQVRIGAHITGFRTGGYEWSLAVGHVRDSFQREGIYGRLGIMLRPPRQPFFEN